MSNLTELASVTANPILDAALTYARAGLRVFPVYPINGEWKPARDWPQKATSEHGKVAAFFDRRPAVKLAIACGPFSGALVIDLDVKGDKDGIAELAKLEAVHGVLPATATVRTPSGGLHHYFRCPPDLAVPSRAGDFAPGIDVRGGNTENPTGYVLAPPTVKPEGAYTFESGRELLLEQRLPDAPDWLLYLCIFNRRERGEAEALGLGSAEAFGGLPASEWRATFDQRSQAAKAEARAALAKPLDSPLSDDDAARIADAVDRYVHRSIEGNLETISKAPKGARHDTAVRRTFRIAGLLNGAMPHLPYDQFDELKLWAEVQLEATCYCIDGDTFLADPGGELRKAMAVADPYDLSKVVARARAGITSDLAVISADPAAPSAPAATGTNDAFPSGWFGDPNDSDPPREWLIKNLLPARSIGFIAGQSGAGKSAAMLMMAVDGASGTPFFGKRTKGFGTCILAAEGYASLGDRFRAEALARGVSQLGPIQRVKLSGDLGTRPVLDKVFATLTQTAEKMLRVTGVPLKVVAIDTLAQAFVIDENDAKGAGKVIHVAKLIEEKFGVTVLLVHHHGKDEIVGLRGSSAFQAAADFVITVAKGKTQSVVRVTKQKDARDIYELGKFGLCGIDLGKDEDGDSITAVRAVPGACHDQDAALADLAFVEDAEAAPPARKRREKPAARYQRVALLAGEPLRGLICDEEKTRACLARDWGHTIGEDKERKSWKRFVEYWHSTPGNGIATTQSPTARPHH